MNKARLAYYSGTGGTRMAAEHMARQFGERKIPVEVQRLKEGSAAEADGSDLLVILYAVYAFGAPEPVVDWVERLAPQRGKAVAVISVSGGGEMSPNTACRWRVIKMLEGKGYRVVYENMLVMPSNIAVPTKAPLDKMLLDILPKKTEKIVEDLCGGIVRRNKPHAVDRGLAVMGRLEKHGAHWFGRRIQASADCNGCGLCAGSCPSGNIIMDDGKPIFQKKCYLCMLCLYSCPRHALKPGAGKIAVIKTGLDLKELAAQPPAGSLSPQQLKKAAPGIAWMGVRKYLSEDENE